MILLRRDRRGSRKHLVLRVGLFFLAAGLWLAGVMVGNPTVTAVAIVVTALAVFLGLIARRPVAAEEGDDEEEGEEAGSEDPCAGAGGGGRQ